MLKDARPARKNRQPHLHTFQVWIWNYWVWKHLECAIPPTISSLCSEEQAFPHYGYNGITPMQETIRWHQFRSSYLVTSWCVNDCGKNQHTEQSLLELTCSLLLVLLDMLWLSAVVHTTHSQDMLGASSCLVLDVTALLGTFYAGVSLRHVLTSLYACILCPW